MKTKNQIIGKRGEEEACSFLVGEGHRILRRNWRAGHLEVDIISLKDRVLHIVEVKTLSGRIMAPPETKVNLDKQRRLVRAANAFLNGPARAGLPADLEVQFDIVAVVFTEPAPEIEYFPAAFIPIYF